MEAAAEVTANIGRSITLSCQAKGNPEPRLVWNRNGETITGTVLFVKIFTFQVCLGM